MPASCFKFCKIYKVLDGLDIAAENILIMARLLRITRDTKIFRSIKFSYHQLSLYNRKLKKECDGVLYIYTSFVQ